VFLLEVSEAASFGELARAAAADPVGGLLCAAIAPGCRRLADR
jgi:hypothetical protein